MMKYLKSICLLLFIQLSIFGQKPIAGDIGIPFNGTTGKFNAMTDVKGVEVGYSTIISGQGKNISESGFLKTPIILTNTNNAGVVSDAVLKWFVDKHWYKEDF